MKVFSFWGKINPFLKALMFVARKLRTGIQYIDRAMDGKLIIPQIIITLLIAKLKLLGAK